MNKSLVISAIVCGIFLLGCSGGSSESDTDDRNGSGATPTVVPTPIGTPNPPVTVEKSLFDGFESGWGHFLDGGEYSSLSSEKAFAGSEAARLEGNHGSSSSLILRRPIDLSRAESITINFWIYGQDLADGDVLAVYFSDGTQWQHVSRDIKGDNFGDNQFSNTNIVLSKDDYNFSRVARIRMTSSTIANPIFIDNISVTITRLQDNISDGEIDRDNGFTFGHDDVTSGCLGCHNNLIAEGKSSSHIETSDQCQTCHIPNSPDAWAAFTYFNGSFDHTGTVSGCLSCHNEVLTTGKGPLHIDSSNECEQCHSPQSQWRLVAGFAHVGITTGCFDCHNGDIAEGKNDSHILSSEHCENCHTQNQPWSTITRFDHAGIVDNCVSCHNGVAAVGKKQFHIPSSDSCEACHSPNNGWWLNGEDIFDHGDISTGCIACHNGSIVSGKSSNHILSSDICENCHVVAGKWNEVAVFSHEGITDNCVSCHNGVEARGKSAFHISSGDNCESCHLSDRGWSVDIGPGFSHANLVDACVSCHNNTITAGKGPSHIDSNDRCEVCHTPGRTWNIEVFTHDDISGECSACHDGNTAVGKTENHIPSPDICESCHLPNNSWQFEFRPPFSHTGINGHCASCHNGTIVIGKSTDHIPSSNDCQVCHNAGGSWLDAKFSHGSISTGCASCHNGTLAVGKSANHISSSSGCESCHLPENNWEVTVVANFDHLNVNADCSTCHNGTIADGKPPEHIPSSEVCENCHTSSGIWTDASFNHDGITDGCSSCHNGTVATGQPNNHFNTAEDCSTCHRPAAWSLVSFVHSNGSAYPGDHREELRCTDCHRDNQQSIPWQFNAYTQSCAGCHANDYEPGEHRNASVGSLRNCAGSCHKSNPEHSVRDRKF